MLKKVECLQCNFMNKRWNSTSDHLMMRIFRKLSQRKNLNWAEKLWLFVFNFFFDVYFNFFVYHKINADCISAIFSSSLLLITYSSPSALRSTVLFRSRSSRSSVAVIIVWTLYKFDGHSFTRFRNFFKMNKYLKYQDRFYHTGIC